MHPARLSDVTDSQPRQTAAVAGTGKRTPAKAKSAPKTLAAALKPEPTHRHPNLGLAPVDMTAGFANTAERLRRDRLRIAGRALVAATQADPTILERYDEVGRRRLLHDSEVLTERLAMCLASDNTRWLAGFAEWIAPSTVAEASRCSISRTCAPR